MLTKVMLRWPRSILPHWQHGQLKTKVALVGAAQVRVAPFVFSGSTNSRT
jgi:hypothetical protein